MNSLATRFAPSPNGHLHPGHAFSALTAWDWAKANSARFVLRIEDTDRTRSRTEFEQSQLEDLAWLGLEWETPVRRQSEHMADYQKGLDRLTQLGVIYPCFCTRKDITEAAIAPHGPEGVIYPGTCRHLSQDIRATKIAEGTAHALRIDATRALAIAERLTGNRLTFTEEGSGPQGETGRLPGDPTPMGDAVIARKDGVIAYHLAVVMDDAAQGITHIIRGQDLFFATPMHRVLQVLLDLPEPTYHHHRLIIDDTGERMAKRRGSKTLRDLRAQGTAPEDIRRLVGLG
ncbi:tRNA glutamyl-Q(34) synthetase GluQRS [Pyruvatibacter sp.]|uniref:tRNA glutamyl-Q(34) synthetase GluQRS n=1 Tax=Pyruvatibacter sp. TaxID=1981328 RepID=UPI00326576F1